MRRERSILFRNPGDKGATAMTNTITETQELVLGQKYTDRFKGVSGPAMEIISSIGGCYLVAIQMPPKEDGEVGKMLVCFDSHLDDEHGNPVRRPDAFAARAEAIHGKKFRDPSSGFVGTATGIRGMENGTEQIALQPEGDGKSIPTAYSIDSNQLEAIPTPVPVAAAPRVGPPASVMPRI